MILFISREHIFFIPMKRMLSSQVHMASSLLITENILKRVNNLMFCCVFFKDKNNWKLLIIIIITKLTSELTRERRSLLEILQFQLIQF